MVLVTGGTGLLGAHLLLHLLRKQISVRAIHRKGSNLANVERVFGYYNQEDRELFHRVDWVVADLNDIPALEKAFENMKPDHYDYVSKNYYQDRYYRKSDLQKTLLYHTI